MDMAPSQQQAPAQQPAQSPATSPEVAPAQGVGAHGRNPRSLQGKGSPFERQRQRHGVQGQAGGNSVSGTGPVAQSTATPSSAPQPDEEKGPTGDKKEDVSSPSAAAPAPKELAAESPRDLHTGPAPRGPTDHAPLKPVKMNGETGAIDVKSGSLNLRDAPGGAGKVLAALPKGTVVTAQAKQGDWMQVKAWSEFAGKEGWILASAFRAEPDLTLHSEDHDTPGKEPEPYVYQEVKGRPFIGKPSASDAEQGGIGDCFLIAAMGAVANARPDIIRRMISPQKAARSYTVTFYEVQRDGSYKPTAPIKVDAWFPTKDGKFQYALSGTSALDANRALWPAIVEKAYAQWQGGYDKLDQGGWSGDAMSAMMGADALQRDPDDYSPKELSDVLRQARDAGKAITAYTPSKEAMKTERAFTGSGIGPYSAKLDNTLVKDSLTLSDTKGKAGNVMDDRTGKLSGGGASGQVDHSSGKVEVRWADSMKAPDKAEDLLASYEAEYWLSRTPPIVANHAYVVKGVDDKGLIDVHNPWGSYHPGKVTPELFQKHYESMDEVAPPPARPRA